MIEPSIKAKLDILFAVMRCHRAEPEKDTNDYPTGDFECKGCNFVGLWPEYLKHIRQLPDVVALEAQSL